MAAHICLTLKTIWTDTCLQGLSQNNAMVAFQTQVSMPYTIQSLLKQSQN